MQAVAAGAIGGASVGQAAEGLARHPISVRYPREIRDSVDDIVNLPVLTPPTGKSRWRRCPMCLSPTPSDAAE